MSCLERPARSERRKVEPLIAFTAAFKNTVWRY